MDLLLEPNHIILGMTEEAKTQFRHGKYRFIAT